MPSKVTEERRRIGRPPAGTDGERVKDYPQLSIRLPAGVKATLHALSVISARPQWRLIADSIECYVKTRPEAEQKMVADLIGRGKGSSGRSRRHRPAKSG